MQDHEAFGLVLKKVRKKKRLAQEDFDSVSSRTYLSAVERGLKNPTLDKIGQLASVMDVHPLSLLAAAYLTQHEGQSLDALLTLVKDQLTALDIK